MVFPTPEDLQRVSREYQAIEGGYQTLARLMKVLEGMVGEKVG